MAFKSSTFSMLGASPVSVLQEHMTRANACVETLIPFFEAAIANDWSRAEKLHLHIVKLEHSADEIKNDLRIHLPKKAYLPIPRPEILELLTLQDAVANQAKYIATLVFTRNMKIPQVFLNEFILLLQRAVDTCNQTTQAIDELDNLLATGFQSTEMKLMEGIIEQINKVEQDADDIQLKINKKMFILEKTLPPLEIIFLYKVVAAVGQLADKAQHVGEQVHLLLAQ